MNNLSKLIESLPAVKVLLDAIKQARIMATEAYLSQDGRSIIAASDFKDIEQFLIEALQRAEELADATREPVLKGDTNVD